MKLITVEKIYNCLLNEKPEIILDDDIIKKGLRPIKRMLDISGKKGN